MNKKLELNFTKKPEMVFQFDQFLNVEQAVDKFLNKKENLERLIAPLIPTNLEETIQKLIPEVEDGKTPIKGIDYDDGKDGETPSDEKIISLIEPLIPEPIPGNDGKTPKKGVDYFTKKELESIKKGLKEAIMSEMTNHATKEEVNIKLEEIKKQVNKLPTTGGAQFLRQLMDVNVGVPTAQQYGLTYNPSRSEFSLTAITGGGSVETVTGLNTDNTDPANPVVRISVDGVTVTGAGTPGDPLVAVGDGTGDVHGPASSTDNAIARFDSTTGKIIQNSGITIADGATGTLSGTNTGDQTITNSSDATSHTVTLSASGGSVQLIEGSNITLTTGGTASAGTVTIAATGGSGSPGGSTTQVQFNDAGSFGGDGGFTWDKTTNQLSLGTLSGTQSGAVIFPYGGGLSDTLGGSGVDLDAGGFSAYVNGGGQFSILDNNVGATATLSTASLTADRTYTLPNLGGTVPVVLSAGRPGTSKTNSTIADQDFASIYTIPANTLVANKMIRVTLNVKTVTGVSTATITGYVKLGSTKVITSGTGNIADSSNVSQSIQFYIMGTAAPGASVSVEASTVTGPTPTVGLSGTLLNQTSQPVAGIATNGTLNIVYGVQWSATGSTETVTIMSYLVEALN